MSYELIDKKESKEERLELSLFLPLDGSFFYFQNIKKYRLPQTLGRLGFTSSVFTFAFRIKQSFFCAKRNNHNINNSGSFLSYFSPFKIFFFLFFFVDIIDTHSPRPHLGFLWWREEKYEQINNSVIIIWKKKCFSV